MHKLAADIKLTFALTAIIFTLCFAFACQKTQNTFIVGKDILPEDISEFYYTYSSSTFPPKYLRYRFYIQDEQYMFFYENREGKTFPLTESNITVSETVILSQEEWTTALNCLQGGKVEKRKDSTESGNAGPWMYLYWNGDRSKYQEFTFTSLDSEKAFESFCILLQNTKSN